jgi:hypothetical protein
MFMKCNTACSVEIEESMVDHEIANHKFYFWPGMWYPGGSSDICHVGSNCTEVSSFGDTWKAGFWQQAKIDKLDPLQIAGMGFKKCFMSCLCYAGYGGWILFWFVAITIKLRTICRSWFIQVCQRIWESY